jgi:hypothetical protein
MGSQVPPQLPFPLRNDFDFLSAGFVDLQGQPVGLEANVPLTIPEFPEDTFFPSVATGVGFQGFQDQTGIMVNDVGQVTAAMGPLLNHPFFGYISIHRQLWPLFVWFPLILRHPTY